MSQVSQMCGPQSGFQKISKSSLLLYIFNCYAKQYVLFVCFHFSKFNMSHFHFALFDSD